MPPARVAIVLGAIVGLSSPAAAQVCEGVASFVQGPVQLSGSVGFTNSAKTFGGGVGVGGGGLFGRASIGTVNYDTLDGSSRVLSVDVGYQVALDQDRSVYICPELSIGSSAGPDNVNVLGSYQDLSATNYSIGLAIGGFTSRSTRTKIVPTGTFAVVKATLKTSDNISGASTSQKETYTLLGFGVGFVFGGVFALRPDVAFLLGLGGTSTSFGAVASVNFGRGRSREGSPSR